ncbi:CMD domain protein [Planctomonas sp. JC2975]|uniref:CMD domain protein n=1 Tax=Planctomonas sp. JC2975 TaxID=2729626 RepID=UPI0014765456|nr:CMD domain protein [Planctomonas sp. JC2975]NNC13662.1 CMD domain protein [Planctomonas sp. JC2975]
MPIDVIDHLVGVQEGDPVFALRLQRPEAKRNAQSSYDALFSSDELKHVSRLERLAIAYWAVALAHSNTAAHYGKLLAAESPQTIAALEAALSDAVTTGPYGDYPKGPLTVENVDGLHWTASPELTAALGIRLTAALEHTHLLTYRPRDASADALQTLLNAGWDTTGIVTLSQLVSFLNFQLRVVAGLTVLKGELR